ncbi:hypothetical protein WH367_05205 [Comamonas sp. MYb21]
MAYRFHQTAALTLGMPERHAPLHGAGLRVAWRQCCPSGSPSP